MNFYLCPAFLPVRMAEWEDGPDCPMAEPTHSKQEALQTQRRGAWVPSGAGGGRAYEVTMHISHPDVEGRDDLLQFVTNTLSSATKLLRDKFRSYYIIPRPQGRPDLLKSRCECSAGLGWTPPPPPPHGQYFLSWPHEMEKLIYSDA